MIKVTCDQLFLFFCSSPKQKEKDRLIAGYDQGLVKRQCSF